MLICDLFDSRSMSTNLNEMAEEMADIVSARGLLKDKKAYQEFLEYLNKKHGEEYAKNIDSQAKFLAKSIIKNNGSK
jgi:peptide subunit release factor 1 (eRF1)